MTHFKVKKGNYLCNWHCKHECMKFQTSFKRKLTSIIEGINSVKYVSKTSKCNGKHE